MVSPQRAVLQGLGNFWAVIIRTVIPVERVMLQVRCKEMKETACDDRHKWRRQKNWKKTEEGTGRGSWPDSFPETSLCSLRDSKYYWQKCCLKWEVTGAGKVKLTDLRRKMERVFRGSKLKQGKWRHLNMWLDMLQWPVLERCDTRSVALIWVGVAQYASTHKMCLLVGKPR